METVTEWLERLYRENGPDADRAQEALRLVEAAEFSEDAICALMDGRKTGDKDVDGIVDQIAELGRLKVWAEWDATFKEFGDLDEGTLERFARAHDKHEAQTFALQAMAAAAGLIGEHDYDTDPLPLIRMFLPVD